MKNILASASNFKFFILLIFLVFTFIPVAVQASSLKEYFCISFLKDIIEKAKFTTIRMLSHYKKGFGTELNTKLEKLKEGSIGHKKQFLVIDLGAGSGYAAYEINQNYSNAHVLAIAYSESGPSEGTYKFLGGKLFSDYSINDLLGKEFANNLRVPLDSNHLNYGASLILDFF